VRLIGKARSKDCSSIIDAGYSPRSAAQLMRDIGHG